MTAMQEIYNAPELTAQSRLSAKLAANTVLTLATCAIEFSQIERVPRYDPDSRENDAEHSFMLAMVATEIAEQYYPDLDHGLVTQFSIVHDLVELETGDVASFALDDSQMARKVAREHAALDEAATRLSPYMASLLQRYEAQVEVEARLVSCVDKQLPVAVDVIGPGRKVMEEDYGIHTLAELDATEQQLSNRLRKMFPEREFDFLHSVRDILAQQFAASFSNQSGEVEKNVTVAW